MSSGRSRYAWGNDADPAAMLDWWVGILDSLAGVVLACWSAPQRARSRAPASVRSQLMAEPAGERGPVMAVNVTPQHGRRDVPVAAGWGETDIAGLDRPRGVWSW